jgi:polyphosphate kinase
MIDKLYEASNAGVKIIRGGGFVRWFLV